jgi:hypothetical protein
MRSSEVFGITPIIVLLRAADDDGDATPRPASRRPRLAPISRWCCMEKTSDSWQ